jgi:hypothetical protein
MRRKKARSRVTLSAKLNDSGLHPVFDLSSGGCLIGMAGIQLQPGDKVRVSLHLPMGVPHGPRVMELNAIVRWRREVTLGVEFIDVPPLDAAMLGNVVSFSLFANHKQKK